MFIARQVLVALRSGRGAMWVPSGNVAPNGAKNPEKGRGLETSCSYGAMQVSQVLVTLFSMSLSDREKAPLPSREFFNRRPFSSELIAYW